MCVCVCCEGAARLLSDLLPPHLSRLGEFRLARAVADGVLDRLSPSSQHFQDVRKKISEVDDIEGQLVALRTEVSGTEASRGNTWRRGQTQTHGRIIQAGFLPLL